MRLRAILVSLALCVTPMAGMAFAPTTAFAPPPRPLNPDLPPGFTSPRPVPRPDSLQERAEAILERERRARLRAQNASSTANRRINEAATSQNALSLDDIALIGVFGTDENRRALLRLQDGSFVRISRGATVDGWRVIAVGEDQIRLLRTGEVRQLMLPE